MKLLKALFLCIAASGIGFTAVPTTAQAQGAFNGAISNPFIFCSLPKPCKHCQPFRRIYQQICPAGKPSPEARKQFQDSINANPELANTAITPEEFKSQLTPAIQSAYQDEVSLNEVKQYIYWLSKQPVPNGTTIPRNINIGVRTVINTMADYWAAQGITDPINNPKIRETATNVIQQVNQKIVASISAGTIPQNPKPWF